MLVKRSSFLILIIFLLKSEFLPQAKDSVRILMRQAQGKLCRESFSERTVMVWLGRVWHPETEGKFWLTQRKASFSGMNSALSAHGTQFEQPRILWVLWIPRMKPWERSLTLLLLGIASVLVSYLCIFSWHICGVFCLWHLCISNIFII